MHYNIRDVFYSQYSYQNVLAASTAIFKVVLLQQYEGTNVVSCVFFSP